MGTRTWECVCVTRESIPLGFLKTLHCILLPVFSVRRFFHVEGGGYGKKSFFCSSRVPLFIFCKIKAIARRKMRMNSNPEVFIKGKCQTFIWGAVCLKTTGQKESPNYNDKQSTKGISYQKSQSREKVLQLI